MYMNIYKYIYAGATSDQQTVTARELCSNGRTNETRTSEEKRQEHDTKKEHKFACREQKLLSTTENSGCMRLKRYARRCARRKR